MKRGYKKFNSGVLHEKHAVATPTLPLREFDPMFTTLVCVFRLFSQSIAIIPRRKTTKDW